MKNYDSVNTIKREYDSIDTVDLYENITYEIGLLEIEKYLIKKYVKKESTIIDVGCGCGRATFGIKNMGYHNIVGVDICKNMIIRARKIDAEKKSGITFYNDDIRNISIQDIDVATFWFNGLMIVPGWENRKEVVNHIYQILKKNGLFIFTTPIMPDDYDEDIEKTNILKYSSLCRYEFGDRFYDYAYYIHFDSDDDIIRLCSLFELLETGVCERTCPQTGRGYNLAYREKYWVFRRR